MDIVLHTERLMLRPLGVADIDSTYRYASDKGIKYMMFLPAESIDNTRRFLENAQAEWEKREPTFFEFAIVLNGEHIGAISAYLSDDGKTAELGWIIRTDCRRRGYVTEAATALLDFVLNTLDVENVIAHCDKRNIPSARVMEKIGMTLTKSDGERFYPSRNEKAEEYTYSLTAKK